MGEISHNTHSILHIYICLLVVGGCIKVEEYMWGAFQKNLDTFLFLLSGVSRNVVLGRGSTVNDGKMPTSCVASTTRVKVSFPFRKMKRCNIIIDILIFLY